MIAAEGDFLNVNLARPRTPEDACVLLAQSVQIYTYARRLPARHSRPPGRRRGAADLRRLAGGAGRPARRVHPCAVAADGSGSGDGGRAVAAARAGAAAAARG